MTVLTASFEVNQTSTYSIASSPASLLDNWSVNTDFTEGGGMG